MSNSNRLHESIVSAGYDPEVWGDEGTFYDWDVMEVVDDLHKRVIKAEKALEKLKMCKKCKKQIKKI